MQVVMRAAFVLALAAGLCVQHPAWAQSDTRSLVDRLDRLERDLSTLQAQTYRGQGSGGTTVITSPALGGGSSNSGGAKPSSGMNGDAYSMLDDRINNLESQLRDLTGQVEKSTFAASQLSGKLDRMQADNDFRFKELESRVGGGATGGAPNAGAGNAPATTAPANAAAGNAPAALTPPSAGKSAADAPAGSLVHPPAGGNAAPAAAPTALVGKTPQEQFDYAFGLLKASDNPGASKAFQAFVAQHPQDPLAGNAMYWLAQISYSQGQYDQAAVTFLDAYRKYPKSAKAGESLLKVGLSMSNLSKKKEACAALQRFSSEYPDAADNLRRQAASEKQKLGC
ncbi:tol-pal system protein YbgF [Telmatospirillum sp.]|uniref:tol-pal system protein YbgF n=1 Tax=Telmatospirillum sp. TaxID=2079197 RepID=UPI00284D2AE0|nr:tol-pal system protein YbgF [Telmatospirillum sp.]MDR3437953.1 tol-pal system protein YbgF [Telmatospirillum sp.]